MLTQLLTSRRIPYKLLWISLSFSLPIAVLLYFMIAGFNRDIKFAEQELAGNEYQRPLHRLLQHLAYHQLLTAAENINALDLASVQGKADQAFQELDSLQQRTGQSLQVTESGLAQRLRSASHPEKLIVAWQELRDNRGQLSRELVDVQHRQLRNSVQQLVAHTGDTSNLILDPDLDSYYLMDVTMLGLPRLQDRLLNLRLSVSSISTRPEVTMAEFLNLVSTARLMRDADFDVIVANTRTALAEDPNYHGPSSSMRQIEPALDTFVVAMETLLKQLDLTDISQANLSTIRTGSAHFKSSGVELSTAGSDIT
jgi:methyl-accepting chemotaxis protein